MNKFKRGDIVKRVEGNFRHTKLGELYKVRCFDGLMYLDTMDGMELDGSYDEDKFVLALQQAIIQVSLDEAVHKCKDIKNQIEVLEKELKIYTQVMASHGVKFI